MAQFDELILCLQTNLFSTIIMCLVMAILICLNMALGAIMAWGEGTFNPERFLLSLAKGFLIVLCGIVYCECLDVLPLLARMLGIELPSDIMTFAEVISIGYVCIRKYAKECLEKFKIILNIENDVLEEENKPDSIKELYGE